MPNTGPFWIGYHIQQSPMLELIQSIADIVQNPVKSEDLHMTLFYCGDNDMETKWPRTLTVTTRVELTGFALLGDALVVTLEPSKILTSRFADVSRNFPTTFPDWIPHITIGYRSSIDELKLIQNTSLALEVYKSGPAYAFLEGEFINTVKNPDSDADTASYLPEGVRIDTSAKSKAPKLEKLLGRGGLLRAVNTAMAKSSTLAKAWDGTDFDAFKASSISMMNAVRETWDLKNTLLEEKRQKERAKRAVK